MIKGSLLIGLQHRKWFASHEAGELHWIRKPVLSAIIFLTGNQAVSLLTSFYCKIHLVQHQWQMDEISQNMTFCPHIMSVAFFFSSNAKSQWILSLFESLTAIKLNFAIQRFEDYVLIYEPRFHFLELNVLKTLKSYMTSSNYMKWSDIKENLLNSLSFI